MLNSLTASHMYYIILNASYKKHYQSLQPLLYTICPLYLLPLECVLLDSILALSPLRLRIFHDLGAIFYISDNVHGLPVVSLSGHVHLWDQRIILVWQV